MKRSLTIFAFAATLAACTTNDQGKRVIDVEAVKQATLLTCALAPTAGQIAQLVTDNKNVKTARDAVALLCAAALPIIAADAPAK